MRFALCSLLLVAAGAGRATAQTFRNDDPVIRRMWEEGMTRSQAGALAQVLMDSIGPRLAGSPGYDAAVAWISRKYEEFGIPVRRERYGTWRGWQMGPVHADLIAPRTQTLNAHLMGWSAGTRRPVEGEVVLLPEASTRAAFDAWARTARGKFVLVSAPEMMCRARQELEKNATPATVAWVDTMRMQGQQAWRARTAIFRGDSAPSMVALLDSARVAGIISTNWSGGWGATRVFAAPTRNAVAVDLSCEDYGLLARLATNNQGPRLRIAAESRELGTVPQFNVIAEIRGSEKPNEYVLLGAHLDSWHGATGKPVREELGPQGRLRSEGQQTAAHVTGWGDSKPAQPPGRASIVSHSHECRYLPRITLNGLEGGRLAVAAAQCSHNWSLGIEE